MATTVDENGAEEPLRIARTKHKFTVYDTPIPVGTQVFIKNWNNKLKSPQQCWIVGKPWNDSVMIPVDMLTDIVRWKKELTIVTDAAEAVELDKDFDSWKDETNINPLRRAARYLLTYFRERQNELAHMAANPKCLEKLANIRALEERYWSGISPQVKVYFKNAMHPTWEELVGSLPTYITERKSELLSNPGSIPRGNVVYVREYQEGVRHSTQYPGSAMDLTSRAQAHRHALKSNRPFGREHGRTAKQAYRCLWKVFWISGDHDEAELKIFEQITICLLGSYNEAAIRGILRNTVGHTIDLMALQAIKCMHLMNEVVKKTGWRFKVPFGISLSSPIFEMYAERATWLLYRDDKSITLQRGAPHRATSEREADLRIGDGRPGPGAVISFVQRLTGRTIGFVFAQRKETERGFRAGALIWPTIQIMIDRDGNYREHDQPYGRLSALGKMTNSAFFNSLGLLLRWEYEGQWYESWHQQELPQMLELMWAEGTQSRQVPSFYRDVRDLFDCILRMDWEGTLVLKPLEELKLSYVPIIKFEPDWEKNQIKLSKLEGSVLPPAILPRPCTKPPDEACTCPNGAADPDGVSCVCYNTKELQRLFPTLIHGPLPEDQKKEFLSVLCARCYMWLRRWDRFGPPLRKESRERPKCNYSTGICRRCADWGLPPTWIRSINDLSLKAINGRFDLMHYICQRPLQQGTKMIDPPRFMTLYGNDAIVTDDEIDNTTTHATMQSLVKIRKIFQRRNQKWMIIAKWSGHDGTSDLEEVSLANVLDAKSRVRVFNWFRHHHKTKPPYWLYEWVIGTAKLTS